MRLLLVLIVMLCWFSSSAFAGRAFCPRVTSQHNADTTDLARFRNFAPWKDKQGNELAIAIWQYLCDYETGLYHFYEVHDGPDPYTEYSTMREPLKMLNVYNCGYCGIFGPTAEGILYGCGFTTGRSFGLAAWNHCATEIYYDNAWHYFDVDVRGAIAKADGTIASLNEARTNKQLWLDSVGKIKPFFPHNPGPDGAAKVAGIYARNYPEGVDFQYRWFQGSHTADYSLRPGESFIRYWQPQDKHWNHRPEYVKEDWVRKLLLTEPVGMKPNHRDFTKWNHGEGLWTYKPNLTSASSDFADGVYSAKGLAPGKDGLTLSAEKGEAVFQVFTPFVIAQKVNDILKPELDSDASLVFVDAAVPVKLEVSTDNGLSWQDAGEFKTRGDRLDLTKLVKGTYGYLARFSAEGKGGDVAIKSLSLETWVQVAPISLPRLKKGTNRLRYDAGDRYDGITQPVLVLPNVGDPEDLKKYVDEMPKDYDPKRNLARIQGDLTVKLAAPAGMKIAWFSVGGTFTTNQEQAAKTTANRMAYAAVDVPPGSAAKAPTEFKEIYKADAPTWAQHWRYNYDTDVKCDKPADLVYVKYTGKPGVNVVRACLHVVPAVKQDPGVKITHGYKIGDKLIEKAVDMAKTGDYTLDCDGDVENVFVKIEKPSGK